MFLKHYNNIDFLRVIFMLGIIIGHTNRVFFPNADFQFSLQNMCVDAFFIISGVFLASSIDKLQKANAKDVLVRTIYKRATRLYPTLFFSICVGILFLFICDKEYLHNIKYSLWSSIFLLGGINGFPVIGDSWYVASLFWMSLLISFCLASHSYFSKFFYFPMIIFLSVSFMYSSWGGLCLYTTPLVGNWFSAGNIKAVCDLAIGAEVYYILPYMQTLYNQIKNKKLFIFILEVLCTYLIGCCFTKNGINKSDYLILAALPILLLIFLNNRCVLYKFANDKIFSYLGKYIYSIYLMHGFLLKILNKYFSLENIVSTYLMTGILSFIFGILMYYLQKFLFAKLKQILFIPQAENSSLNVENPERERELYQASSEK